MKKSVLFVLMFISLFCAIVGVFLDFFEFWENWTYVIFALLSVLWAKLYEHVEE